jgi:hypothetical protein
MSTQISLKEAERRAFKTKFDDGLWDILLGSYFMMFVVALYLSPSLGDFWSSVIIIPGVGFVFMVTWLLRKFIVTPRIGNVKFGKARRGKLKRFTKVMLVINCTAFILGLAAWIVNGKVSGLMTSVFFGLMLLIAFSLGAYFLEISRFYVYGLGAGLAPIAGEWLWRQGLVTHHGFPVMFGGGGGIMMLIGLFIFIRLLYNNPAFHSEMPSEKA